MIGTQDRRQAIELIEAAVAAGAGRAPACALLGLSLRTVQRWRRGGGVGEDRRRSAERPVPPNALSEAERAAVLAICNGPEHASLPPSQIVPRLADQGVYLASESTFYRILRAEDAQHHRGRAKSPRAPAPPPSHTAHGPCQVWCWDITYLPGPVRGMFFYLYLILDLYSRKIVGWEVHAQENSAHASALVQRAVLAAGGLGRPLVLHADNGSPQKGSLLMATLDRLGVTPSYSRPRVSDDNADAETLFRTLKYRPAYPSGGFADLETARARVLEFVGWYNTEHRHSALAFVTPEQRHAGADAAILAQRQALYRQAKAARPERWSGAVRDWTPPGPVTLNPTAAAQPPAPATRPARRSPGPPWEGGSEHSLATPVLSQHSPGLGGHPRSVGRFARSQAPAPRRRETGRSAKRAADRLPARSDPQAARIGRLSESASATSATELERLG